MPPEDNKFKVGIDPIFSGQKTAAENTSVSALNVLNNQKYSPTASPAGTPFNPPANNNPKSIVRTYKGDLENAIAINHLSSINIAIAENQKMRSQIAEGVENGAPASDYSKGKIIIFISALLVIIGIIAIITAYIWNTRTSNPAVIVRELSSLITTEYKDELNVDSVAKNKFVSVLSSKLNDYQIPVNNFYNPYITIGTSTGRRLISSSEFVTLADFKIPDLIKRTLLPDFMVGTYSLEGNLPFIILKTSYFENAYAGMLAWENYLEKDLRVLFRFEGYQNSGGILDELKPTVVKKFEDGVLANKDVRLIRGADGKTMLLYGIIDKETIIITVKETAFKEILDRLNKEKTLKR